MNTTAMPGATALPFDYDTKSSVDITTSAIPLNVVPDAASAKAQYQIGNTSTGNESSTCVQIGTCSMSVTEAQKQMETNEKSLDITNAAMKRRRSRPMGIAALAAAAARKRLEISEDAVSSELENATANISCNENNITNLKIEPSDDMVGVKVSLGEKTTKLDEERARDNCTELSSGHKHDESNVSDKILVEKENIGDLQADLS